ncbi:hypothetical protein [Nocardioides sp.]|uniref:hypothetical protein n=1 Tax=Nocardioides sp. TaxID=35761 RepID=UPI002728ECC6|nr:hypothetical protein [Nocardioides sp.]MDO9456178.1 hypothetical protein [Nocardioides sp.]
MNGLDDLRTTLETHAADVAQGDTTVRRTAIHHRIGVVRRRRRVVASGAVAAVVAVVGAVSLLPGDDAAGPDAAAPSVFGVDVPREIDSLGFPYDYQDHSAGEGRTTLELGDSDRPRLISWGTSTADRVEVAVGEGDAPQVFDGSDFTDWTYLAPGDAVEVTARVADGSVALAVYTLGEGRPDGVTADGVTFRATRAGSPLLGATIGEPGQNDIVVEPTERADRVFYAYYCAGGPADAWVTVETGSGGFAQGACDGSVPVDPAALGGIGSRVLPEESMTTRLYVTDGEDGPRVESDTLRIGLGVYADPAGRDVGDGVRLAGTVEHGGHTWRLVDTVVPALDPDGAVVQVPDREERMIALVTSLRTRQTLVSYAVDGDQSSGTQSVGGGTFTVDLPVDAQEVAFERRGGAPLSDRAAVGFGFYVRAD